MTIDDFDVTIDEKIKNASPKVRALVAIISILFKKMQVSLEDGITACELITEYAKKRIK